MNKTAEEKNYFLFSETLGRTFILLKTSSGSYTIMCKVRASPHPCSSHANKRYGLESRESRNNVEKTVREKYAGQLSRTMSIEEI